MNNWLIITLIFMVLDLLLVFDLMFKKTANASLEKKNMHRNRQFFQSVMNGGQHTEEEKMEIFRYFDMKKIIMLDKGRREIAEKHLDIFKAEKKFKKGMRSIFKVKRIESAMNLGLLGTDEARKSLEDAIAMEKDSVVKLYLANALSDIGDKASLPFLVNSLLNARRFYRMRVNLLIADFGEDFDDYVKQLVNSERLEIKELLVDFASVYYSENSRDYLKSFITHQQQDLDKLRHTFGENGQKSCKTCTRSFIN